MRLLMNNVMRDFIGVPNIGLPGSTLPNQWGFAMAGYMCSGGEQAEAMHSRHVSCSRLAGDAMMTCDLITQPSS